jgi:hypothetical protein
MKRILVILCITCVVAILAAVTSQFVPMQISGRVVSSTTGLPVGDALVAVQSGNEFEETGTSEHVRTDQFGNFTARARGSSISISAWKRGYALGGTRYGSPLGRLGRENVIRLRELTPTTRIEEHDEFYALVPGTGFSFSTGKRVKGDSPEADFVVTQYPNKRSVAFIEAQGEGGIQSQVITEATDFYNSPFAPIAGYQRRIAIPSEEATLYFLRTRDGGHYAKFRFMALIVMPPQGSEYVDLESVRMIWAYQSDGTKNLEIIPSEKMPFPFYGFGLNPNSIN